jgi:hypothetical protein
LLVMATHWPPGDQVRWPPGARIISGNQAGHALALGAVPGAKPVTRWPLRDRLRPGGHAWAKGRCFGATGGHARGFRWLRSPGGQRVAGTSNQILAPGGQRVVSLAPETSNQILATILAPGCQRVTGLAPRASNQMLPPWGPTRGRLGHQDEQPDAALRGPTCGRLGLLLPLVHPPSLYETCQRPTSFYAEVSAGDCAALVCLSRGRRRRRRVPSCNNRHK